MKRISKDRRLTEALTLHGGIVEDAYNALLPMIGEEKALTWTFNPVTKGAPKGSPRQPLPLVEQQQKCRDRLEQLAKRMSFAGSKGVDAAPDGGGDDHVAGDGQPSDTDTSGDSGQPDLDALVNAAQQAHDAADAAAQKAADAKAVLTDREADAAEKAEKAANSLEEFIKAREEGADDATLDTLKGDWQQAEDDSRQAQDSVDEAKAKADESQDAADAAADDAKAADDAVDAAQPSIEDEILRFFAEVQRLREFAEEREMDTFKSMRVEEDGLKTLLASGIPVDGLLFSLVSHWQDDTREQANIGEYDYRNFGHSPEGAHAASEYVLALIRANIPVWMYGPAGTGKSTCARYAASALGLDYYEVNLAGALPSAVKGKDRLNGFVEAEFCKAYEHGGVLCLEEFDMAHPLTAGAINNAIANGHFHNDANGKVIKRHPDFRIVATANTLGLGATHEHNARVKLDGATLDRFRMGRVQINRDDRLMQQIINVKLADAGLDLRV